MCMRLYLPTCFVEFSFYLLTFLISGQEKFSFLIHASSDLHNNCIGKRNLRYTKLLFNSETGSFPSTRKKTRCFNVMYD